MYCRVMNAHFQGLEQHMLLRMEPPIWLADNVRVIRTAVCDFVCVNIAVTAL
jgi:hypothetical protein